MLATGKFDAFETHKRLARPVFALHAATMSLFYACDAIHLFYPRLWNIMKTWTSAVAVKHCLLRPVVTVLMLLGTVPLQMHLNIALGPCKKPIGNITTASVTAYHCVRVYKQTIPWK